MCGTEECPSACAKSARARGCRRPEFRPIRWAGASRRRLSRKERAIEYRWRRPYGMWIVSGERVVLFDRRYIPIAQRWSDGRVEWADANEWIPFTRGLQYWFYSDNHPVTLGFLEAIEHDFITGRPLRFVTLREYPHGALVGPQ